MKSKKDLCIADIIQAAKELEEFISTYEKELCDLERILRHKDEYEDDPEVIECAERELSIRSRLKESIEDFEHDYILV